MTNPIPHFGKKAQMSIRDVIEKQMIKFRHFFKDWKMKFFVLVGFDTSISDDIFRIIYLRDIKIFPYIMRHENCYTNYYKDFYTDVASWCNQNFMFKKYSFEEYLYVRYTTGHFYTDKPNMKRIRNSLYVWNSNQ